jgi:hypothetical protein
MTKYHGLGNKQQSRDELASSVGTIYFLALYVKNLEECRLYSEVGLGSLLKSKRSSSLPSQDSVDFLMV